jgi:hypothetical protein
MKDKFVLFAFNGEAMCFVHVLLNAMDMHEKGFDVKVVIEGAATRLIPEMAKPESFLFGLFEKVRNVGLLEGACRACSAKMGVLQDVESQGISLLSDMTGHPSMSRYINEGFQVITF